MSFRSVTAFSTSRSGTASAACRLATEPPLIFAAGTGVRSGATSPRSPRRCSSLRTNESPEPRADDRRRRVADPMAGHAGRVVPVSGVVEREPHVVDEGHRSGGPDPLLQFLKKGLRHGSAALG